MKWNELKILSFGLLCAVWYCLYNFKNVKNTHGGVPLLAKLQPATLLKQHSSMGVFHVFKIVQMVPKRAKPLIHTAFFQQSRHVVDTFRFNLVAITQF